jgi:hypothetical protein
MREKVHRDLYIVLLLAGLARFIALSTYPYWYVDEADFLEISARLASGELRHFQWFGFPTTIGRPLLFFEFGAIFIKIFGAEVLSLRLLAAIASVLTVREIYLLLFNSYGAVEARVGSMFVAVSPLLVFYGRMALTYNLTILFATAAIRQLHYVSAEPDRKRIQLSLFFAACAAATDYWGTLPALIVLWKLRGALIDRVNGIYYTICLLPGVVAVLIPIILDSQDFFLKIFSYSSFTLVREDVTFFDSLAISIMHLPHYHPSFLAVFAGVLFIKRSDLRETSALLGVLSILYFASWRILAGHYLLLFIPLLSIGTVGIYQLISRAMLSAFNYDVTKDKWQVSWVFSIIFPLLMAGIGGKIVINNSDYSRLPASNLFAKKEGIKAAIKLVSQQMTGNDIVGGSSLSLASLTGKTCTFGEVVRVGSPSPEKVRYFVGDSRYSCHLSDLNFFILDVCISRELNADGLKWLKDELASSRWIPFHFEETIVYKRVKPSVYIENIAR